VLKPVWKISLFLILAAGKLLGQEVDMSILGDENLNSSTIVAGEIAEQIVLDSSDYNFALEDFHLYNIRSQSGLFGFDLGNSASILNSLDRSYSGFASGWENFTPYHLDLSNREIQFSQKRKAFSRARYVNGAKRENVLEVDLASRFGKLLYAGFHFDRVRAQGFYDRQTTDNTEINIFSGIRSKDFRYQAFLSFGWNGITNEENGGLANDSAFEFGATGSREFQSVNLLNAERRVREFGLRFDQGFILTKWKQDTVNRKSANRLRLLHRFETDQKTWVYEDIPDTNFYENTYVDSITLDSTYMLRFRNELGVQFVRSLNDSMHKPRIYAYAAHEFNRVTSDTLGLDNQNVSVGGKINLNIRGKVRLNADAEVWLLGYNQGDIAVNAEIPVSLEDWQFGPKARFALTEPGWKYQSYSSNHFKWSNTFGKQSNLSIGLNVANEKWRTNIEFDYQVLGNYIYFDTTWLPKQAADVQQLINLKLDQKLNWRWIHFDVNGKISYLLSGDAISVPLFNGRASLYYENRLFKRRLKLQVGMDVWFYTEFEAYGYIPALAEFNRSSEKKIGNYPYLDAWISFRRKKLSFFFMVKHWNAGLMGNTYYNHLHYPGNDMAIKFGVNWVFLD
jgi:hypothetical protein